ncbi:tetraspanin-1 [Ictalurus furcatus]|uniref:tetraspanin-1 n=1 Tax=Ictalurus furcatus TaxID=66913 RepID=UPI002350EE9E|nr:tetraspanin-1 [Ictalurus furcatus]
MACKWILKVLMVVFNCAIFLAGAAIVVIGVLVEMKRNHILRVVEHVKDISPELAHLSNAGYLLIAVGAVLTFMGFLGCCGACCDNKCMLMTFFVIILILFVVEVVSAVYILLYQSKVGEVLGKVSEKFAKEIKEQYDTNEVFTKTWNETMTLLKCCGFSNYTDFTGSAFVNRTSLYPEFCCSPASVQCVEGTAASQHVPGCLDAVVKLVKSNSALLGAVAICVAAIEVAAMIVSLILYNSNN